MIIDSKQLQPDDLYLWADHERNSPLPRRGNYIINISRLERWIKQGYTSWVINTDNPDRPYISHIICQHCGKRYHAGSMLWQHRHAKKHR